MIRQLGFPHLFISQSCAETKWVELLQALGELVDKKKYTEEQVKEFDWKTKCRLITSDSPTVVHYFDHRFHTFFNDVLKSNLHPIGEIVDFFWRYEFASRGAIHVHWFAYLKNAPVYSKDENEEVIAFYDNIISCSSDVKPEHKEYLEYQLHRHAKRCQVGTTNKCKFHFPQPPMD